MKNCEPSLESRIRQLERRLRAFQILALVGALGFTVVALVRFVSTRALADEPQRVLHLRGLVIEDAQGRPRILVGAPIPAVAGRKRDEEAVGFVLVGKDGVDRVSIGAPTPNPQMQGRIAHRIGAAAGIEVNDKDGNERAGLGVLDNDGRAVLGLDYPSGRGEAIALAVIPDQGPHVELKDTSSLTRAGLLLDQHSAATLFGVSPKDKSSFEVSVMKLAPYALHRVVIPPSEKAFDDAIEGTKP